MRTGLHWVSGRLRVGGRGDGTAGPGLYRLLRCHPASLGRGNADETGPAIVFAATDGKSLRPAAPAKPTRSSSTGCRRISSRRSSRSRTAVLRASRDRSSRHIARRLARSGAIAARRRQHDNPAAGAAHLPFPGALAAPQSAGSIIGLGSNSARQERDPRRYLNSAYFGAGAMAWMPRPTATSAKSARH